MSSGPNWQQDGSGNPAFPNDLAEWVGAVRLTHFSLQAVQAVDSPLADFQARSGEAGYSFRMLLTLLTYAYGRAVFGSDELAERLLTDADLRYLCAREFPDAETLRAFRRHQKVLLRVTVARLVAFAAGAREGETWLDAEAEADRRLELAMAADSLALDC